METPLHEHRPLNVHVIDLAELRDYRQLVSAMQRCQLGSLPMTRRSARTARQNLEWRTLSYSAVTIHEFKLGLGVCGGRLG